MRFDKLRRDVCLRVEEFEDVVFCPGLHMEEAVERESSLGTVRDLATGLADTVLLVLETFETGGLLTRLCSLALSVSVHLSFSLFSFLLS